jgi:hypothetical protein
MRSDRSADGGLDGKLDGRDFGGRGRRAAIGNRVIARPFAGRDLAIVIIHPAGPPELIAPLIEEEAEALVAHLRLVSPESQILRARCETSVRLWGATRWQ